ncbi:MAG: protein translocase subunit SecD [Planctomycetota bacterium]|nr:protein translocase subunit SecD [Planctomycetota bacterium]
MSKWVYWVSLAFIAAVLLPPAWTLTMDPMVRGDLGALFKKGIDLEGGTSLIYQLRAPQGGKAPDASEAKRVIQQRIDPNGTRQYVVRPIGKDRLEIVLPGRPTRVRIDAAAVTREALEAAQKAALAPNQNAAAATVIKEGLDAFLKGTRLAIRIKPSLYLDDVQARIRQAARERMANANVPMAVVGTKPEGEQWEEADVYLALPPSDSKAVAEWSALISNALSTQQDVTRVKRLVQQAGFLEFRIVAEKVKDREKADFDRLIRLKLAGQPPDTPEFKWYPLKKGWPWYRDGSLDRWGFVYVVDQQTQTVEALVNVGDGQNVTGQDLTSAFASSQEGDPIVSFQLKPQAGARFATLTKPEVRNRFLAIILDGVIQSAPTLKATLSTGGIIEGYRNNIRERDEVVTILRSGSLAASLGDPVLERTVGSELGADNIHKGFIASLVGLLLVVVFMGVYYRLTGLVADLAMILNLVLTVCIMYEIKGTWTLPGIAGLLLSLAMAVDANVLINERLREEKGKEGSLAFALKKAYERAFTTILDSNLTTIIPAFVLLLPGLSTEEVKGFAIVMIIGILISMFTAVVVTRMILETGLKWGWFKDFKMFQLFKTPNLDWMRFARVAVVLSVVAVVAGAILFLSRGEDKYDIEFTGGTQVELKLRPPEGEGPIAIDQVRRIADGALGGGVTVQELEYAKEVAESKTSSYLISVPALGEFAKGERAVKEALAGAFARYRPAGQGAAIQASAAEITEAVIRAHLDTGGGAKPAAGAPAPAALDEAASYRYIPEEQRQYLGKVLVTADVSPPMSAGEFRRRVDANIRDRYPYLAGTVLKVDGRKTAGAPGEFSAFDVWVRQDFGAKYLDTPIPTIWADVVKTATGVEETFASTTSFEPTMAGEMWHKAVIAIVFSLLAMVFYIWVRFAKLASGLAAVIGLVHDVFFTLGCVTLSAYAASLWYGNPLLLTNLKINLTMIGAFLTLIGYSVNDTIVVFDRMRENRGKYGDLSISVVNSSINQTLSRTVLTSFTVFVATLALYFLGGGTSSVHGLAFVMLIGTIVGCYSSVVISSPILVMRDYLYKVYVWSYPFVGIGLLAYFGFVWQKPGQFFGNWVGWVWAALQVAWVVLATWAAWSDACGRPWLVAQKAPGLVRGLTALSFIAPVGAAALSVVSVVSTTAGNWAGPAALGCLMTCPATYALYRINKRMESEKINPAGAASR